MGTHNTRLRVCIPLWISVCGEHLMGIDGSPLWAGTAGTARWENKTKPRPDYKLSAHFYRPKGGCERYFFYGEKNCRKWLEKVWKEHNKIESFEVEIKTSWIYQNIIQFMVKVIKFFVGKKSIQLNKGLIYAYSFQNWSLNERNKSKESILTC